LNISGGKAICLTATFLFGGYYMLLKITESCHMGCTHCLDDAKPSNNHMTFRVFQDAISFFNQFGGVELIISGGEPTENPLWLEMLEYALKRCHGSTGTGICHITLATNGMNISNSRDIQSMLILLMDRYNNLSIQVTHVDQYYPQEVDLSSSFFKCERVVVCTEIEGMYPIGRARDNNLPWQSKCSKCFNIRSSVRNLEDLNKATIMLNLKGKFCTPQVDIYGNIKLGESRLCPIASTIYKPTEQIINDICSFTCSYCDMVNQKLPELYLHAIGEVKKENM
jgi:hypothetical protein